jgi:hypothetical protein
LGAAVVSAVSNAAGHCSTMIAAATNSQMRRNRDVPKFEFIAEIRNQVSDLLDLKYTPRANSE